MDMGIDLGGTPFAAHGSALDGERGEPLDWGALRARLTASYAARSALFGLERSDSAASFDRASAAVLGTYPDGSMVINPNASFAVKPVGSSQMDVAGGPITGDRGPK